MRDMLEGSEPYPLTAWRAPFQRIHTDLDDALELESHSSPLDRGSDQRAYLVSSVHQFWDALDRVFALAATEPNKARDSTPHFSLNAAGRRAEHGVVARLLVSNNESEQEAAERTQDIYTRAKRNVYIFGPRC